MIDFEPLLLSFEVAALATCFASVLGVTIAALLATPRVWGRELIDAAITAPMVLPPTVLGYYLLVLLGRESAIGHAFEALTGTPIVFSRGGAVVAATIGALPLISKAARAALESVDVRLVAAARTLGASHLRALFTVSLPLSRRGILAGVMLGFARALGDFGVTLMVAGNIPGQTRTASLAIYDAVLSGRDADATHLSLIMTALAMSVLIGVAYLTKQRPMASEALRRARLLARLSLQRGQQEASFRLDVALDFGPGLSVLFGPSGSGKTTILSIIAGLLPADAGRVTLGEQALFDAQEGIDLAPNQRRVALVFQSLALFPHLDALGNVAYGVPGTTSKAERSERANAWLVRMRVAHLAGRYPGSFSGGEAQRVALARALASEPRALLLDEPFSALDQALVSDLSAELVGHVDSLSLPVVLVTHDRRLARELGREVTLLRAGRVERVGPAREVLAERD